MPRRHGVSPPSSLATPSSYSPVFRLIRPALYSLANMLKLNSDILRLVVSYLSMEDARSLSATSRYLHPEARARALAEVRIKTPKTFDAACKFYLAEHSDRINHLRTLDMQLDDSHITRHTCRKLADLLDHACNLRTFMLDCAEQWILAQPRIEAVLQRLQAIHAMGLLLAGWRALRTIRGMQGKLRNIELMSLVFPLTTEENEPHASSAAMLEALAPHASARSIALVVQDQATSPPDVQLQQALELRLGNASAAAPSLDVLAHVFPALRILFLDGPSMTVDKPADNIECWECLDYVSGTFPALRAWAPKCRVHHLEIRDAEWEGRILAKNERVSDVSRVINGTSPVALTIYRSMAAMYFGLTYADWVGFLYNMPRLRVLAVDLSTGLSWSKTWIVSLNID